MEEVAKRIRVIGLILLIVLPIVQYLDAWVKSPRDCGMEIYGDNFFKEIIGVKTIYYNRSGFLGDQLGTELQVPGWMRQIGIPPYIYWGWKSSNTFLAYENSPFYQVMEVIILRWIIKLFPLYIFLLGLYLGGSKKE